MLKNDTLKNGTSRIGLYGSAPPSPRVQTLEYGRVVHIKNRFFEFGLLFCQKLSVSVSYKLVSCMRDSTVRQTKQPYSAIQCAVMIKIFNTNPKWMEESERTGQIKRFLY